MNSNSGDKLIDTIVDLVLKVPRSYKSSIANHGTPPRLHFPRKKWDDQLKKLFTGQRP